MLGDALIVGLGSWLISWVAFIEPTLALTDERLGTVFVDGLSQPIGSVVLFLVAVHLFSEHPGSDTFSRKGGELR